MKKEFHPELKEVERSEEKPLAAMFAVTYRCQCRCAHLRQRATAEAR